jgi:ketosteroid isomerase-like protein
VDELEKLIVHQQLSDLVTRYCRAVDRRDVELLLTCYFEDAIQHHGAFTGSPRDLVDELAKGAMSADRGPIQHLVGNRTFLIEDDVAYGETYTLASTILPDQPRMAFVRYVDRFERRAGEWRIAERTVVMDASPESSAWGGAFGQRDRTDPSYALPWPRL